MRRSRTVTVTPPEALGRHRGLAYALFRPAVEPRGGVVILHGAGSVKESHYDFARLLRSEGIAALAYDQRGHGESEGPLGDEALEDLAAMASLLPAGPLGLRGSSMGGYLALLGGAELGAAGVVAICPASAEGMRRALRAGRLDFAAEERALDAFLAAHDEAEATGTLGGELLLMHAEGDEVVPVEHSRELLARAPRGRLVAVPGGDHRSIQHDGELQALSARFLARALSG